MPKVSFPQAGNDFHKTNGGDHATVVVGPSLTRQEFAEECDINTLMKKYDGYVNTGPNGLRNPQDMFYADFTQMPDNLMAFHQYMAEADHAFMQLPAIVRKEFENSAYQFVEFAADPDNLPQLREWGLAPPAKPEKPEPMEVRVVNPEPAPVVPDAPKA